MALGDIGAVIASLEFEPVYVSIVTTKGKKGNPHIDQLMFQHVERMER